MGGQTEHHRLRKHAEVAGFTQTKPGGQRENATAGASKKLKLRINRALRSAFCSRAIPSESYSAAATRTDAPCTRLVLTVVGRIKQFHPPRILPAAQRVSARASLPLPRAQTRAGYCSYRTLCAAKYRFDDFLRHGIRFEVHIERRWLTMSPNTYSLSLLSSLHSRF